MKRRICPGCKQNKKLFEFYKGSRCKLCTKDWRDKRLKRNRSELVSFFKIHPCIDCGEKDLVVLGFDHSLGNKKFGIGDNLGSYCWEEVEKEIAKCEVVCANCHTRRTAKQFSWWRINPIVNS